MVAVRSSRQRPRAVSRLGRPARTELPWGQLLRKDSLLIGQDFTLVAKDFGVVPMQLIVCHFLISFRFNASLCL